MADPRLKMIQARQEQWMRERQAEMDRSAVTQEMGLAEGYSGAEPSFAYGGDGGAGGGGGGEASTSYGGGGGGYQHQHQHQYQHQQHGGGSMGYEPGGGAAGGWQAPPSRGHQPMQGGYRPEEVMDKITERITDRLRDELRLELRKETAEAMKDHAKQGAKLEGFLASEIESHTCPICYDLMLPPDHSPMLLFPCGHTFCSSCLKAHEAAHRNSKCPYCRQAIASKALNMSLQQIIQSYSSKREKIEKGELLDDPTPAAAAAPAAAEAMPAEDQIRRDHHTKSVRVKILRNELEDTREGRRGLLAKLETADTVLAHLRVAEDEAQARLKQVMAEVDVLHEQMREQESKRMSVEREVQECDAKGDLIERTLDPLERELDKLHVLMRGIGGGDER